MKPLIIHSEAKAELDAAIAFYEEQRPGLGMDLQAAVERASRTIQENPQLGAPYKRTEFRHCLVGGFPYALFYAELEDAVWLTAVAHEKRRPDYWRRRRIK